MPSAFLFFSANGCALHIRRLFSFFLLKIVNNLVIIIALTKRFLMEVSDMFTKETIISEVLVKAPQSAPLFYEIGMHCLGCAMASGESLEEACQVHGVDPDDFIAKLNAFVAENT